MKYINKINSQKALKPRKENKKVRFYYMLMSHRTSLNTKSKYSGIKFVDSITHIMIL